MADRYTQVYKYDMPLYAEGLPIVILAEDIVKDNTKNKLYSRVKMQSISEDNISQVELTLVPKKESGEIAGTPVVRLYDTLGMSRGDVFGGDEVIELSSNSACEIEVQINKIVFGTRTVEYGEKYVLEALPKQKALADDFGKEQVEAYKREIGGSASYVPIERCMDLWFCSCGEINRVNEEKCFVCGADREKQIEIANTDFLSSKVAEKKALAARMQKEIREENRKAAIGVVLFFVLILITISVILRA